MPLAVMVGPEGRAMSKTYNTAAVYDQAKESLEASAAMNARLLDAVRHDMSNSYDCLLLLKKARGLELLKPGMDIIVAACAIIKLEEAINQVVLEETGTELAKLN